MRRVDFIPVPSLDGGCELVPVTFDDSDESSDELERQLMCEMGLILFSVIGIAFLFLCFVGGWALTSMILSAF